VHVVKPGETLFSITQQYNLALGTLREWNNLDVTLPIYPGQKIIVKKASEISPEIGQSSQSDQEEQLIIHKVKSDETLYGIAQKYGVSVDQIMKWNNKKDFSIDIDEELQIYTP
jgi:membrane-bound lytic murein transglycosylase D